MPTDPTPPIATMTTGRLRAIESYMRRDGTSRDVLLKCGGELITEVKRLREALMRIQDCDDITAAGPIMIAADAIAEPDLGPPDIVCRRADIERKDSSHD